MILRCGGFRLRYEKNDIYGIGSYNEVLSYIDSIFLWIDSANDT